MKEREWGGGRETNRDTEREVSNKDVKINPLLHGVSLGQQGVLYDATGGGQHAPLLYQAPAVLYSHTQTRGPRPSQQVVCFSCKKQWIQQAENKAEKRLAGSLGEQYRTKCDLRKREKRKKAEYVCCSRTHQK